MKVPVPQDPKGDAEGSLLRADVLDTLFRHGVSVTPKEDGDKAILQNANVLEVQYLPPIVGGKMINYLSRKFDIPLTEFYYERKKHFH